MNTTNINVLSQVSAIPGKPGIYKYFNSKDEVIYVGKAKNLRNRVRSYFYNKLEPGSKTAALVRSIARIEHIETLSEFEALILEAELIKIYKPKYNIALKDDKSYLYIVIRSAWENIGGVKTKLPIVLVARKPDLQAKDIVFGPFPGASTAKSVVRTIRRVLPYRDCSTSKFNRYNKINTPCLYGHIGLCQAPCVHAITPEDYRKDVSRIRKLLMGDSSAVLRSWEKDMKKHSAKKEYEKALKYRDTINKFNYVRQDFKSSKKYIDNPYLVQDLRDSSLAELKDNIIGLTSLPKRIECYDISNISGVDAVGSMVVAIDGDIDKSEYRRFKIKNKNTPDDFAMMEEVIYRRLKRDWEKPDLLVVDGGKGQVAAAMRATEKLNIGLNIIGLAKKEETIVMFNEGSFVELKLPRDNAGLQLLQRLRDEAHRFAQSYHHKLRLNSIRN